MPTAVVNGITRLGKVWQSACSELSLLSSECANWSRAVTCHDVLDAGNPACLQGSWSPDVLLGSTVTTVSHTLCAKHLTHQASTCCNGLLRIQDCHQGRQEGGASEGSPQEG